MEAAVKARGEIEKAERSGVEVRRWVEDYSSDGFATLQRENK